MDYQSFHHFDAFIIRGLNGLLGRSVLFDKTVNFLLGNPLSTALLMAIFWACWFRPADAATTQRNRESLIVTLIAGAASFVIARALALQLPFRLRPRFDPSMHFIALDPPKYAAIIDWSGFPSDHAAMFIALSSGLCVVSWRLGLLTTLYVACTICFPRVYLGYHYPTDILVGMLIGLLIAYVFNRPAPRRWLAVPALRWEHSSPQSFYLALFFLTFEFATVFDSLRDASLSAYHIAERLLELP